jgi:site-specific DNA recombinase
MRVAIYVRVSTYQQVQTQTIAQQLERIRTHSHAQGWTWDVSNVFRDDGYSGASLTRPGLDRLREQVASGCFERVVITAPDRLARNYVHQMLLIEEFERYGCTVEFVDHPMSKEPNDQLLLQIRGAVAEYERTLIAERMRRGRQHKYRAGLLLPWTRPPYGYTMDPEHPRALAGVRLDAVASTIVQELFARYCEEGQSLAGLSKQLMAQHIPAPRGGARWTHSSLRRILTNPVYTGVVYAGRTRVRPIGKRRSPLAPIGRRPHGALTTPPEEWIVVGQIPAIVTQQQFDQVQAKLATNGRFARRNNRSNQYLLRNLVSCGRCRLSCVGQSGKCYSYYSCAGRAHPIFSCRDHKCEARLIPMRQLDEVVWADVCAVLQHPDTRAQALGRAQRGAWLPQELQARRANLHKAHTSLSQQIDRLTQVYLEGLVGLEEYRRRRQEMEARLSSLAEQAHELERQADRQFELGQVVAHIRDFCARVGQGLEQASFEQKRQLVKLVIDRIVVRDEEVEIRYVIPTSPQGEHTQFYHLRSDYCRTLPSDLRGGMSAGLSAGRSADGAHGHGNPPAALQPRAPAPGPGLWQSAAAHSLSGVAISPTCPTDCRSGSLDQHVAWDVLCAQSAAGYQCHGWDRTLLCHAGTERPTGEFAD